MKLFLLFILLFTTSLFSFDTRSHVWIAQEVIKDLEDSKLTIEPYGEFTVDSEIVSAILENKKIYRMGNIGPDGFPDVVGGQVTVHPGLVDGDIGDDEPHLIEGWKSDRWFKWVLNKAQTSQEKAFAYGYLGHGAADTFAHTYVNMYAGDIFDMNDGETDVEKRHIFLEKFISDRLPAFKDVNGVYLGEAFELVAVDDDLPISFIKATLLMNENAADQYRLSGTASYLAKMYDFRQDIADLDTTNRFNQAWLEQVDHAIDEYIKTSSKMSQGFMDVNGDTYSELTRWIECYGGSFTDPTTLASKTTEGACNVSQEVDSRLSLLNKFDFNPFASLKHKVKELTGSLGNEIIDLIGVSALEIITVREQSVSEESLNEQFGIDESEKNLLLINDIAGRVKVEMGLNAKGELNPQMYHVLYNAVVLSKLSLLSREQLNLLITRAKVASTFTYATSSDTFNILFNSIKTIDGNHQWMHQAPPYPRLNGFSDQRAHFYGYENDETHGFKLFESDELRFALFNKIFKGPLALGLEEPSVIHFENILSSEYPYISCEANPFPNGINDKRCETITTPIDTNETQTPKEQSWFDELIEYLKEIILSYFTDIVGQENIISTTQTKDGIEIITKVPDDGIEF